MSDTRKAKDTLMELAKRRASNKYGKKAKDKGEISLRRLGLDPEITGRSLAGAKLLSDVIEGREVNIPVTDNLDVTGKYSDKEKALGLRYKKKFN